MPSGDTYESSEFESGLQYRQNLTPDGQIDCWSFFDYKDHFRNADHIQNGARLPSWVPFHHRRRLRAYEMLDSFYKSAARRWANTTEEEKRDRREYGDPFLIVEAVVSSVLGDDPKIQVDGVLLNDSEEEQGFPKACQELLKTWADKESFFLRLRENERNAVKLGDGVLVIGWDDKKKRPRFRVYDPASYFPVEDPISDEDYPEKVHIAYEFEETDENGKRESWIRRITWELRDCPEYEVPWSTEKVAETCFYSDMKWRMGDAKALSGLEDLSGDNGFSNIEQDEVDLGIDFIPVVHIPNMATEGYAWGVSVLAPIMQLLDDISSTDTDLQNASQLTGSPVLGIGGAQAPKDEQGNVKNYGPGTVYETGEGKLDYLDTSHSLDALLKLQKELRDTMSVNARTPSTLLGRVDPGKVQAGVILTLSFAPHTTMVREMRDIRKAKERLALRFVLRMYQKDGQLEKGEIPTANVTPGSFLPADKMEIGNILGVLVPAKVISRETAIQMCIQAGYPIEDIAAEIKRIQKADFSGADDLFTATNDTELVRQYLQVGPAPAATTAAEQQALQNEQTKAKTDQIKNPPPADPTKPGNNPIKGTDPTKPGGN